MTPQYVALVRESFALVAPAAKAAAELFYGRLFEIEPALRRLFRDDLEHQGKMLMAALSSAVQALDNAERLAPMLRGLGARHVAYGVETHHYAIVGEALLWTLEQGLGPQFTPQVKAAWQAAYAALSSIMLEGAEALRVRAA